MSAYPISGLKTIALPLCLILPRLLALACLVALGGLSLLLQPAELELSLQPVLSKSTLKRDDMVLQTNSPFLSTRTGYLRRKIPFHRHSAWELAEGLEVHSGIKTLVGVSVMISLVPEC